MAPENPHIDAPYPEHINQHRVTVEDDILFVRFIGEYLPEDAVTIMALLDRIHRERGHACFLADLSHAKAPGPETRRTLANWQSPVDRLASAYFGASWNIRTVATLIHSAMRVLGRKQVPSYYCKTEAEARAWLDEQRPAAAGSAR